jgi:hypothetical protein
VAPHLSPHALERALVLTRSIRYAEARAVAIAGLAPSLPAPLLPQALAATRLLADDWAQEQARMSLARYASPAMQRQVLDQMWQTPQRHRPLAATLADLAPHLDHALHEEVVTRVQTLEDVGERLAALAALSPALVPVELQRIAEPNMRGQAFLGVIGYLPEQLQRKALEQVRRLGSPSERAKALLRLAPQLPERYHQEVFRIALSIGDLRARAMTLLELILALSRTTPSARGATQQILDTWRSPGQQIAHRPQMQLLGHKVLAALVQRFVGQLSFGEARQLVRELPTALVASATVQLVHYMPLRLVSDMLNQHGSASTANPDLVAALLVRLATLGHAQEALQQVQRVASETAREQALVDLAQIVPESLLQEVVAIAKSYARDEFVAVLVRALPRFPHRSREALQLRYTEALTLLAAKPRRTVLVNSTQLAPLMKTLGGQAAIDEALVALADICRWFP